MYKHSLSEDEPWKFVQLTNSRHTNESSSEVDLNSLARPLGELVSVKKINDIKKQLVFIPEQYQGFYISLTSEENAESFGAADTEDFSPATASTSTADSEATTSLKRAAIEYQSYAVQPKKIKYE